MASFKSQIINFLLRNRHLFKAKLRKKTFDFNSSLEEFREQSEKSARRYWQLPPEITVQEQSIAGLHCEWLIPPGADPRKVILYVHGGGYVSGSCRTHRGFVATLAQHTGVAHLIYEYRLAPEHPFPAALNDSIKIYQELLATGFRPDNILLAGESAGGGLCLATLLALKQQKIAFPAAAAVISPWTDLTCSSDSYRTKNKLSLAPLNSWLVFSKYYAGDTPAGTPLISPLFGDLKGLPPIFINSGVEDELFEDGEKFYVKAKESGVAITFRAGVNMVHCYPLFAPRFKEATEALAEIVAFMKNHLHVDFK